MTCREWRGDGQNNVKVAVRRDGHHRRLPVVRPVPALLRQPCRLHRALLEEVAVVLGLLGGSGLGGQGLLLLRLHLALSEVPLTLAQLDGRAGGALMLEAGPGRLLLLVRVGPGPAVGNEWTPGGCLERGGGQVAGEPVVRRFDLAISVLLDVGEYLVPPGFADPPCARARECACVRATVVARTSEPTRDVGGTVEGGLDGTFHPARVDVLTQELPLVVALFGLLPIQLAEHFAQRQVMPDAVLPPRLGRLEEAGKTKQKTNQKNKNTIGLVGWLGRWGWLVGERRHRRPLKPPPSRKTRGEGDLGSVAKKGLAG